MGLTEEPLPDTRLADPDGVAGDPKTAEAERRAQLQRCIVATARSADFFTRQAWAERTARAVLLNSFRAETIGSLVQSPVSQGRQRVRGEQRAGERGALPQVVGQLLIAGKERQSDSAHRRTRELRHACAEKRTVSRMRWMLSAAPLLMYERENTEKCW